MTGYCHGMFFDKIVRVVCTVTVCDVKEWITARSGESPFW